ncbi:hypothetical protein ABG067_004929 [Albugo candida]
MIVRYQPSRTDYLTHAKELIAWAQEIVDDGKGVKKMVKGIVSAKGHDKVQGHSQGEDRKCFNCRKRRNLARRCHRPKKDDGRGEEPGAPANEGVNTSLLT